VNEVPLGDIAAQLSGELIGNASLRIDRIGPLEGATPGTISFLSNPRYASQLAATAARPLHQLLGRAGPVPGLRAAAQGAGAVAAGAEVVDEVQQCRLRADGCRGEAGRRGQQLHEEARQVELQQRLGLFNSDARVTRRHRAAVPVPRGAIAHGPHASRAHVGRGAKALEAAAQGRRLIQHLRAQRLNCFDSHARPVNQKVSTSISTAMSSAVQAVASTPRQSPPCWKASTRPAARQAT